AAPAISAFTLKSWGRAAALSRHKAAPTKTAQGYQQIDPCQDCSTRSPVLKNPDFLYLSPSPPRPAPSLPQRQAHPAGAQLHTNPNIMSNIVSTDGKRVCR
ncbi:hypothetical protein ABE459_25075, partial [Pseudomonas sp. TWI923]|uniref:hypothetical protein n=1 Tax=Pseudomonas sp. TWI923 TaxID=3136794 RepID=UPI003208EC31